MGKTYIDKQRASWNLEYKKVQHLKWNDPIRRAFFNKSWSTGSRKASRWINHCNRRNWERPMFAVIRNHIRNNDANLDMKQQLEDYYEDNPQGYFDRVVGYPQEREFDYDYERDWAAFDNRIHREFMLKRHNIDLDEYYKSYIG